MSGKRLLRYGTYDDDNNEDIVDRMVDMAYGFDYYCFLYRKNVVQKPLDDIEHIIQTFEQNQRSFWKSWNSLMKDLSDIVDIVGDVQSNLSLIDKLLNLYKNYLLHETQKRTILAKRMTHVQVQDTMNALQISFLKLRYKGRFLLESWSSVKNEYVQFWNRLISEQITAQFYLQLSHDFYSMIHENNLTSNTLQMEIFSQMIQSNTTLPESENETEELKRMLNADVADQLQYYSTGNWSRHFPHLEMFADVDKTLDHFDHDFLMKLNDIVVTFKMFLEDTQQTEKFYK